MSEKAIAKDEISGFYQHEHAFLSVSDDVSRVCGSGIGVLHLLCIFLFLSSVGIVDRIISSVDAISRFLSRPAAVSRLVGSINSTVSIQDE